MMHLVKKGLKENCY